MDTQYYPKKKKKPSHSLLNSHKTDHTVIREKSQGETIAKYDSGKDMLSFSF